MVSLPKPPLGAGKGPAPTNSPGGSGAFSVAAGHGRWPGWETSVWGMGPARVPPACPNPCPRGAVPPAPRSLKVLVTPSFLLWQERQGEPDPWPSSPCPRNLRRATCPHVPPHSPGAPKKPPPKLVTISAAQVPGKCGMSVGARHPNRAPLWSLPFRPGNLSRPTSWSWLHGKYRGREGGPLPASLPLPPRSPLCLGTSAIFQSWRSPGRRRPRACSRLDKQSGEDAPGAKALSGDSPAATVRARGPLQAQAPSEGTAPSLGLALTLSPPSPHLCAWAARPAL